MSFFPLRQKSFATDTCQSHVERWHPCLFDMLIGGSEREKIEISSINLNACILNFQMCSPFVRIWWKNLGMYGWSCSQLRFSLAYYPYICLSFPVFHRLEGAECAPLYWLCLPWAILCWVYCFTAILINYVVFLKQVILNIPGVL